MAAPLQRFGLPRFAGVRAALPARPVLIVSGVVRRPLQLDMADVLAAGRREQPGDLHCVTTWSATGMVWGGVPFRAVHERLRELVELHPRCGWVTFHGLDGYRACLSLADATAEDVLLADTLHGVPLTAERGGPARLVAPQHYGYKNVRQIYAITYTRRYDPGSAGFKGHRRGRVAREERSALLPGWVWRRVWRRLVEPIRRRYATATARGTSAGR